MSQYLQDVQFSLKQILLKNNLVSFFGSDIHHIRRNIYNYDIKRKLRKIIKNDKLIEDLLVNNQLKIINNEII